MTAFLVIIAVLATALIILILTTRTILTASHRLRETSVSLTIANCGIKAYLSSRRYGLIVGGHVFRFELRQREPAAKKKTPKKIKPPKKKAERKLSFSIWVKIIKAATLFTGRILAAVEYEGGQFQARPVLSNPALAGMAYGWGQAFYGVFPGLRQKVEVTPAFNGGEGNWSGHLTVSIRNRKIIFLLYRLALDLPIVEIIKQKFFKRGA